MRFIPILLFFICFTSNIKAESGGAKVAAIAFYNLENLFDTINDPNKNDEDFLPDGSYRYTTDIYQHKLDKLSSVVANLATDMTPDGAALLGVAEVENRSVLEDFVAHDNIKSRNYQIVHVESPDKRGIDVGLLYNPAYFKVDHYETITVNLNEAYKYTKKGKKPTAEELKDPHPTRDILVVHGQLDGEPMHVLVNHWPSRRGGQAASNPKRAVAAAACKKMTDSLIAANPSAKVIVMGDLNDDPTSKSVTKVFVSKANKEAIKTTEFYNPWVSYYKKGVGTLAWGDSWNLFDQILVSKGLLTAPSADGFSYYKSRVYNEQYLMQKEGRFKGYPFRTYAGGRFLGGYSDHFPTVIYLIKKV